MRKNRSNRSRAVRVKATKSTISPAPPPSHPSLAVESVFTTLELFENIMLGLSMKQLLTVAQRVSKSWKRRIDHSPPLQRHLFFRPDTSKTLEETRGDCVVNPLLRTHFGPMLGRKEDQDGGHNTGGWQAIVRPTREGVFGISAVQAMNLSIADTARGRVCHERFVRAGATWRRMLISQPPPRKLGYIEYTNNGEATRYWAAPFDVVTIPDGLRMGMLWDTIYCTLWSPYGKDVEGRHAFVSWRMRWGRDVEGEEGTSQPDSWTSEKLPYRLRPRDIDVDMIVGHGEAILDEKWCYILHHHPVRYGNYRCRDERWRFVGNRRRASTSWMFRSEDFNEENTLAKVAGDCTRMRY